ncbi:formyltransferase family protein [Thiohalomonas denitrificans]|uniref:formyltransferase family protein n=1 Tax=Thiohalomonas denitrificans TaxID=415747 RepID=UPI0026F32777|nr:formyltransferase family protein [Thiohalomonas denitrificans]
MKIVLVGQKWLGTETLRLCMALGHELAAVYAPTPEDRLYQAAWNEAIPAYKVSARLTAEMVPAGTDLVVAAHAHCFLDAGARRQARLGAIGYHPSLLPRHRGRDAVRWAIHMGEAVTGGTVYWMDDGADTGPIAAQDWCHIRPGETPAELWRRQLAPMGLRLFRKVLEEIENGVITGVPQDQTVTTWEPAFAGGYLKEG